MQRCAWADSSPAMQAYHDNEWGRPQHNQQRLFELLCLETYQAGLSWQTVLNKRAAFNEDFADYDVDQVAAMTTADVERLLTDARIIRHRQAGTSIAEVPATNDLAQHVSKEMKRRGFKFVGPTTIYSYLKATGLINDHVADCPFAPENLPA